MQNYSSSAINDEYVARCLAAFVYFPHRSPRLSVGPQRGLGALDVPLGTNRGFCLLAAFGSAATNAPRLRQPTAWDMGARRTIARWVYVGHMNHGSQGQQTPREVCARGPSWRDWALLAVNLVFMA